MPDQVLVTSDQVSAVWPAFANQSPTLQDMLINTSSQACIDFCTHTFDNESVSEAFDGNNTGILWIRRPVIQVIQVTIQNGGLVLDNADGRDWTVYPAKGKLVRGAGLNDERFAWFWPKGNRNIQVDYIWGYEQIPDKVVMAASLYCKYLFQLGQRAGLYHSETIGDYSYTLGPQTPTNGLTTMGMPAYIADLLSDYVDDMGPR